MKNTNLHKAKEAKNDEFYTQYSDIENEIQFYWDQLENKKILCNCDDATWSNFSKYFNNQKRFHKFEVRCTCYNIETGEGDFRSPEQEDNWQWADIVITNPPFSLFREYVDKIMEHNKKFLIIGSMNAISYPTIFNYINKNKIWLGINEPKTFIQPNKTIKKFGNICWYTNLDHKQRHLKLQLVEDYNPIKYPKYDNYDAINVDKVKLIPCDYKGIIGVPITFLRKFNPDQFEIIGLNVKGLINDKKIYARIMIKTKEGK